jgi:hypothetical protein
MPEAMEWIKLFTSLLTPLVVLVLGLRINRRLELTKNQISREREWESYWASAFLRVADEYNGCATTLITMMARVASYVNDKNDVDSANAVISEMNGVVSSFSSLDWQLQQFSDFAQINGPVVRVRGKRLFHALEAMLRDKRANLEEIRRMQFEFTDAVRLAHAEILSIPPNKSLEPAAERNG